MRRRALIGKIAGAAVWPRAAGAQPKAMPVIGYLGGGAPGPAAPNVAAIRQGLRESGYVEGQNLTIEYRWAEGRFERLPALVAELVGRKVAMIICPNTQATRAAKAATSTIPIVFLLGDDPVRGGLVATLARPGGNVTGLSILSIDVNPKRLELLRELLPKARLVALLVDPRHPNNERVIGEMLEAAKATRIELHVLKANDASEIDAAFGSLHQLQADAVFVDADSFFAIRRDQIVALAVRHAIPVTYAYREFVTAGGLISYGPSVTAMFRQVGIYAGRILKGARPADLPVVQPTAFELVVNLKTANALGLTVPASILARADDVIE